MHTRRQLLLQISALALLPKTAYAKPPTNLPPGKSGGVLGETLSFIKDPFAFLFDHRDRLGPTFRTNILGTDIAVLSGADSMSLFLDEANITRMGGQLNHVVKLFGGLNMGSFDAKQHHGLKSLALSAFGRSALTDYVPVLEELMDTALATWSAQDEVRSADVLRRLALESICANILGIAPGETTATLSREYEKVTAGMISVPVKLPGTAYKRAHKGRKRIFAIFEQLIADRRAAPTDDGLSRIMAAKEADGQQITDDELILELHHIVIAGYIVFGLLAELLVRLDENPEIRDALITELDAHEVTENVTLEQVYGLEYMRRVVKEAKRTAPVVLAIFGKAKREFDVDGFTIPEGWGVWMALPLCNMDKRSFDQPEAFDPERFAAPRDESAQHAHAWMPQGSGPATGHRCLGLEYSELMCQVFLVRLLRGYTWTIPEQDMGYRYELLPPEHRDGLRVRFEKR